MLQVIYNNTQLPPEDAVTPQIMAPLGDQSRYHVFTPTEYQEPTDANPFDRSNWPTEECLVYCPHLVPTDTRHELIIGKINALKCKPHDHFNLETMKRYTRELREAEDKGEIMSQGHPDQLDEMWVEK